MLVWEGRNRSITKTWRRDAERRSVEGEERDDQKKNQQGKANGEEIGLRHRGYSSKESWV